MFDAILVRLKRMVYSGIRTAGVFAVLGIMVRLAQPFSNSGLVGTILIYLAICELALTGTQFLVSYTQLKRKVKEETEEK